MTQPWTSRSGPRSSLKFFMSWVALLKWNSTHNAVRGRAFCTIKESNSQTSTLSPQDGESQANFQPCILRVNHRARKCQSVFFFDKLPWPSVMTWITVWPAAPKILTSASAFPCPALLFGQWCLAHRAVDRSFCFQWQSRILFMIMGATGGRKTTTDNPKQS